MTKQELEALLADTGKGIAEKLQGQVVALLEQAGLRTPAASAPAEPDDVTAAVERAIKPLRDALASVPAVHDSRGAGPLTEQVKAFQAGALEEKYRPKTLAEAMAWFCEGVEDNGKRTPIGEEGSLPGASFFPGYHPGNPRHQFRALLSNYARWQGGSYLACHLHPDVRPALEYTLVAGVAAVVPFVLPMLRQVWPELIAPQVMSVQPMNRSQGRAVYLDFVYDPSLGDPSNVSEFCSEYGNNVSEQTAIPQVKLTIDDHAINMDVKKLAADWSVEVGQNLRLDYGLDAANEFTAFMAREIAQEVNALLLNDMLNGADPNGVVSAGNLNYGCTRPAAGQYTQREWNAELYTFLQRASHLIQLGRQRPATWAIAGLNALARLRQNDSFVIVNADQDNRRAQTGIALVGTLEAAPRIDVFSCGPQFMNAETILLGRKGPDWYDAGAVYCPLIPLYVAGPFVDPADMCTKLALMSRFGYLKVVGNAFSTVTCLPGVAGTPWV